jgi:lambda family phage portal protein
MRANTLSIVDYNGRPISAASFSQDFEGATFGRRLGTWGTSTAGPDTALYGSLTTLRSRSRQLVRNDPNAAGGIDTLVANLVGTGITPRWLFDDTDLKEEIQGLWEDWIQEADADGLLDFYGLQALAARALIEAGEVLVRFRPRRPEDGLSVPLQLQLFEADHLEASYNAIAPKTGNEIRMGIEYNKAGKRLAYWPFKEHPGEYFLNSDHSTRIRVPASEILHVYRPLRPGQKRGAPWLASVILTQNEINQFDDAELVRKKGAAMFGGFIYEDAPMPGIAVPPLGPNTGTDSQLRQIVALEPGTFPLLPPGMKVEFSKPADTDGAYEAFTKRHDRRVARGFGGMTYEKYTGNLEDVNFSSIRAGNLEFQRYCKMIIQNVLVFQFSRPIARVWLDQAVLTGAVKIPDYMENRRKYLRMAWDHDGWEWVKPLEEVQAERMAVRSGFKSRSQVVGERGYSAEKIDQEINEDNQRADEYGNVYDSDPRKTTESGIVQEEDSEGEEK